MLKEFLRKSGTLFDADKRANDNRRSIYQQSEQIPDRKSIAGLPERRR
jgi:hypothetical protein